MFYLTRSDIPVYLPLGFVGVYRYFWFIIKILAWALYKPTKPRKNPTYRASRDVTILVPTIDSGEEIKRAVRSWLVCDPYEIIFITVAKAKPALDELAAACDPTGKKIRVITVNKPNKRNQMIAGINQVKTEITVFCDDDVLWPETMLTYMLAPFEDQQMGAVGTSQTVLPVGKWMTIWEILSAYRITMRNIEITSSAYIDGGVCCLSGRTAAYRTCILRDPDFQWKFAHEYWYVWWFGKWYRFHQHSGDDKFLTRWCVSHQWKTGIQSCKQAELLSTFKNNWRFLKQITRWTRNTWRSDIKSLFIERVIWRRYPFVAFTMFDKFFNPITLLAGPISVIYLCTAPHGLQPWVIVVSYLVWLFLTRLLKYLPHFVRRPQDVLAIPVWIVFNIVFAIMKVYCLFTLHITDWGTRKGADDKREHKEDYSIYLPHWQDKALHGKSDGVRWNNHAGQNGVSPGPVAEILPVAANHNIVPPSPQEKTNSELLQQLPSQAGASSSLLPDLSPRQQTGRLDGRAQARAPLPRPINTGVPAPKTSIMKKPDSPVKINAARFSSDANYNNGSISNTAPARRPPPPVLSSPEYNLPMVQMNDSNTVTTQPQATRGNYQSYRHYPKHVSSGENSVNLSYLSGFSGRDFLNENSSSSGITSGAPSGSGIISPVTGSGNNTQQSTLNPLKLQLNRMRAANGVSVVPPGSQ